MFVILLLDIWPQYGRGWGIKTAPTGLGRASAILLSAVARRALESAHRSATAFVLLSLFELGLIGLEVALVVSAFRHGIQDVQERPRRRC